MSRCWPTADTAWSVARSVGRGPPPSAAQPAAIAPELTSTTLWPAPRSSATSAHSFSIAAASTPPPALGDRRRPDLDDDRAGRRRASLAAVVRLDLDDALPACARGGRRLATPPASIRRRRADR